MPQSQSIFVVGDRDLNEVVAEVLGDAGYAVVTFTDARAALSSLTEGARPHVLLLDWPAPGLEGIAVLDHLHQARPETSVVLFAAAPRGIPATVLARTAAVLAKPCSLDALLVTIQAAAAGARKASSVLESESETQARAGEPLGALATERPYYRRRARGVPVRRRRSW